MNDRRGGLSLLLAALAVAVVLGQASTGEKKEDDKGTRRKGTVVGTLTAKGEGFIEVRADGEEKARKYCPRWVGGAPDKGGGFAKEMLNTFRSLGVGDRVRVEWEFEERPRAVRVEVLKKAEPK